MGSWYTFISWELFFNPLYSHGLLIGVFTLLAFKIINDIIGLTSITFITVFYSLSPFALHSFYAFSGPNLECCKFYFTVFSTPIILELIFLLSFLKVVLPELEIHILKSNPIHRK